MKKLVNAQASLIEFGSLRLSGILDSFTLNHEHTHC